MSAQTKIAFAEQAVEKYDEMMRSSEPISAPQEVISELMRQTFFTEGEERESILRQLESYGFFEYSGIPLPAQQSTDPEIEDVEISRPEIFYSVKGTWVVCTAGTWINEHWKNAFGFGLIQSGSVGDQDAFGVTFSQMSNYSSRAIRSYAYIMDQHGHQDSKVSTAYRSNSNSKDGFIFRLQDYIYRPDITKVCYVGDYWYGETEYDENLAEADGLATSYYLHTWGAARITSLTISSDKKVTATIAYEEDSFDGYSGDVRI